MSSSSWIWKPNTRPTAKGADHGIKNTAAEYDHFLHVVLATRTLAQVPELPES